MPIFEYICKDCRKRFEALLYGSAQPQCPLCHGTNLDQQISVFSVGGSQSAAASSCATSACDMAGTGCGCACSHGD
jgi:putative FmdB family regulatory protein